MATMYRSNGNVEVVTPANGRRFSLDEAQALVGGYVEAVALPLEGKTVTALCDEDGRMKGRPANRALPQFSFVGDVLVVQRGEF